LRIAALGKIAHAAIASANKMVDATGFTSLLSPNIASRLPLGPESHMAIPVVIDRTSPGRIVEFHELSLLYFGAPFS
jgi:hypothetical protein